MPRFFFDCLIDGSLYSDAFGMDVLQGDVSDQAQAVLLNLVQEGLPTDGSKSITVTVRDERGSAVYVAQALMDQHHVVDKGAREETDAAAPTARTSESFRFS